MYLYRSYASPGIAGHDETIQTLGTNTMCVRNLSNNSVMTFVIQSPMHPCNIRDRIVQLSSLYVIINAFNVADSILRVEVAPLHAVSRSILTLPILGVDNRAS